MALDRKQCLTLARVNEAARVPLVDSAHKCIYEKNYAVDSTAVENHLKEQSLVPTSVRSSMFPSLALWLSLNPRMPSLNDCQGLASQYLRY